MAEESDHGAAKKDVNGDDLGESHAERVDFVIGAKKFCRKADECITDHNHESDVPGFGQARTGGVETEEGSENSFVELNWMDG